MLGTLYCNYRAFVCFRISLKKNFFLMFVFEKEHEQRRGRENPKQAPGPELSAQSPTWGSNSQTVRS